MNRRYSILGLAVGLALSVGAGGDNSVTIKGSGHLKANIDASGARDSAIELYQVSPYTPGQYNQAGSDGSPVTQSGNGHTARIGQGATYSGGVWNETGVPVSGNVATVRQTGASGATALIQQTSNNNTAIVNQAGAAAMAVINQGGAGNNSASVSTTGAYTGDGVVVTQTGASNTANVSGMSGGSANVSQSGTGGYVNLENQSSGALNISQQGTNNALTVTNYGTGASAGVPLSITQTGVGGAATTYNPDPAPTGPGYSTNPP